MIVQENLMTDKLNPEPRKLTPKALECLKEAKQIVFSLTTMGGFSSDEGPLYRVGAHSSTSAIGTLAGKIGHDAYKECLGTEPQFLPKVPSPVKGR
jgi:predicted amino acid dehydrogenase